MTELEKEMWEALSKMDDAFASSPKAIRHREQSEAVAKVAKKWITQAYAAGMSANIQENVEITFDKWMKGNGLTE